jgi:bacteriocin-like protein
MEVIVASSTTGTPKKGHGKKGSARADLSKVRKGAPAELTERELKKISGGALSRDKWIEV